MIKYWVMFAILDTGVSYYQEPFKSHSECLDEIIASGWASTDRWSKDHMPSVIGCYEYSEHHSNALNDFQRGLMWQGPIKPRNAK